MNAEIQKCRIAEAQSCASLIVPFVRRISTLALQPFHCIPTATLPLEQHKPVARRQRSTFGKELEKDAKLKIDIEEYHQWPDAYKIT